MDLNALRLKVLNSLVAEPESKRVKSDSSDEVVDDDEGELVEQSGPSSSPRMGNLIIDLDALSSEDDEVAAPSPMDTLKRLQQMIEVKEQAKKDRAKKAEPKKPEQPKANPKVPKANLKAKAGLKAFSKAGLKPNPKAGAKAIPKVIPKVVPVPKVVVVPKPKVAPKTKVTPKTKVAPKTKVTPKKASLLETKVLAQTALHEKMCNELREMQDEANSARNFVEIALPKKIEAERERIAELRRRIEESEQTIKELENVGKEKASKILRLESELMEKEESIREFSRKLEEGKMKLMRMKEAKHNASDEEQKDSIEEGEVIEPPSLPPPPPPIPPPPPEPPGQSNGVKKAGKSELEQATLMEEAFEGGARALFGRLWLMEALDSSSWFESLSSNSLKGSLSPPRRFDWDANFDTLSQEYRSPLSALHSYRLAPLFAAKLGFDCLKVGSLVFAWFCSIFSSSILHFRTISPRTHLCVNMS